MQILRRNVPVVLAFIAGVVLWAQYFVPSKASQDFLNFFSNNWLIIIAAAALVLGTLSALHYHATKIQMRRTGFGYSIIVLVVFTLMFTLGMFPIRVPGFHPIFVPGTTPPQMLSNATATLDGSFWSWMFLNVYTPLSATMFSLLAFFIASAAFRAFRARSFEASALLIAGCIVMIGRVSVGEQVPIWPAHGTVPVQHINDLSSWLLNNPNTAGQTAILMGIILSQIAISLRVIFGIERTYMGGGD